MEAKSLTLEHEIRLHGEGSRWQPIVEVRPYLGRILVLTATNTRMFAQREVVDARLARPE